MKKKDLFIVFLKVVVFACTALLSVLGVTSLTSCSTSKSVDIVGKTTIVTVDTTHINHNTYIKFPKR